MTETNNAKAEGDHRAMGIEWLLTKEGCDMSHQHAHSIHATRLFPSCCVGGLAVMMALFGAGLSVWPHNMASKGAADARGSTGPCLLFAPGTSEAEMLNAYREIVATYGPGLEHLIAPSGLEFVFADSRWPGEIGTPVHLTYSFPPDGTPVSGIGGTSENVIARTLESAVGADWRAVIREAFDEYEALTGNTYTEVDDDGAPWPDSPGQPGVRGDIRIAMSSSGGQGGVIGFNFFPHQGGDMLLDSNEDWTQGVDFQFLRNVLLHENGHGMGFFHSCPINETKLMEPIATLAFDGPQLDERLGMQAIYGDFLAPSNTIDSAADLGSLGLSPGEKLLIENLSLAFFGDSDYFRLETDGATQIRVAQADPTGSPYFQNLDTCAIGGASSDFTFDPQQQQNLSLRVLDEDGQVVAESPPHQFGAPATVTNVVLPDAGTYVIQVRATAADLMEGVIPIQPYNLSVELAVVGDLNDDSVVNQTDLAILLASFGASGAGLDADINGDGQVDGVDIAWLLARWDG